MKATLRIARAELAQMFYSPIAWLLLAVFIAQGFSSFDNSMRQLLYSIDMGQTNSTALTKAMLSSATGGGMFTIMKEKLFLYIPLLTMGLIARETASGSIKLLLSSPVKTSQIVFGKYLAMMGYCALLIGVLLIYTLVTGAAVELLDYPNAWSGLLGLYLLICTYAAIGLFLSSLTSHQVVAAVSTLTVLGVLTLIANVGQGIPIIKNITYWLSLPSRTDGFLNGFIVTKHVAYFVIVSMVFLCFTILKLSSGRRLESRNTKIGKYGLVCLIAIFAGFVTTRPALIGYFDVTRTQSNSLSQATLDILKPARDKTWKLTTYANLLDWDYGRFGSPKSKNRERSRFEGYARYMPNLEMDTVFYYKRIEGDIMFNAMYADKPDEEIAKLLAKRDGLNFDDVLSPQEMDKIVDLEPEGYRLVQHLEIDGKKTFLRMFQDSSHVPFEEEIAAAFKRVLEGDIKAGFVIGHRETSIHKKGNADYQAQMNLNGYRDSLVNAGFDVGDIQLDAPIPSDIDILVISGPRTAFSALEHQNFTNYVARGGNVMFAGDVRRQAVVNPLLEQLGVTLSPGQLLQKSEDYDPELILTDLTPYARSIGFTQRWGLKVSMTKATSLNYDANGSDFTYQPVLTVAGPDVWNRKGEIDLESDVLSFNPETDTRGEFTLGLALTRTIPGKEQRILVVSDSSVFTRAQTHRENPFSWNRRTANESFGWLANDEFPIKFSRPVATDTNLRLKSDHMIWLKLMFYGLVPGLVLLFGFSLLYRRKRR